MSQQLTIALTKGRILEETLPLLEAANIRPLDDIQKSRKLLFATKGGLIAWIKQELFKKSRALKLEIERSSTYIGYKILWIIRLFLEGKRFP